MCTLSISVYSSSVNFIDVLSLSPAINGSLYLWNLCQKHIGQLYTPPIVCDRDGIEFIFQFICEALLLLSISYSSLLCSVYLHASPLHQYSYTHHTLRGYSLQSSHRAENPGERLLYSMHHVNQLKDAYMSTEKL